ncbi:porin [Aquabacterium parvum]|uniref:porin n=1 Tax=Aquabacterium parvum TaxID=70584 RepID=UPI000718D89E|nr:porin [Aquabacterium parvum]MBU0915193.1 porin [Gammaproteobacteria bacterium]
MKKTVLDLAAIAASSAAFAQSSVTLYGVVDASVESVKGDKTVTRVSSDNLASSRIAFKGVEDLGGGLKATFLLDASAKVDNGGSDSAFFSRSAYVGLAGGFGEVRLGRQDSLIGAQLFGVTGAQAYDEGKISGVLAGNDLRRLDNAITYIAPTLVPGLTLAAQFSTGYSSSVTTEDNGNDGRTYGFSAAYANGPLSAGLSYIKANTDVAGDVENTGVLVFGAYDFGVAKLTAYYNTDDRDTASGQQYDDRNLYGFKVAVPVATGVTLTGGYAQVRGAKGDATNTAVAGSFNNKNTQDDKASILTFRAQYDLSKRTALYALFTQVRNDKNTDLSVSGVTIANDKSSRGLAVGVRHCF